MKNYIKEFLINKKKLSIKGFGLFEVVFKSSEIHPILHTFTPPGHYVIFTYQGNESSDELAEYIAQKDKIDPSKAAMRVSQWIDEVKNSLQKDKTYELGSLGSFSFDAVGNIQFNPSLDYDISPESYGLESFTSYPPQAKQQEVSEEKLEKKKRKKRKSVFQLILFTGLIILFMLIIAAGLYSILFPDDFYYKKDMLWMRISQKVKPQETAKEITPVFVYEVETLEYDEEEPSCQEEVTATISDSLLFDEESIAQEEANEALDINISHTKGNTYIVLGSFKEESNAKEYFQSLQSKYDNASELGKGKSSGLWLIGIGPYEREEAERVLRENQLKGWILKK